MNDMAEEVTALSDDVDAGDGDEGTVSPTPATVPKKRGRPANSEKPKKAVTSITGRGRGRPAKGSEGVNKKPSKTAASADGSEEEEGTESDDGSPVFNGDSADGGTAVASKRGRKPKAKRKLSNPIESTGKGRGRPKKIAKTDDGEDDEIADDDDGAANDYKSGKKAAAKGAKKGRGRPKKVNNSDDESSDDKEERRPVGRPPSGGINLNIVRTGKGQGRPKKAVVAKRAAEADKKTAETDNVGDEKAKKRGRPVTSGKGEYSPTGKPRGRPKAARSDDSQNEDGDAEHNTNKLDENSADNSDGDNSELNGEEKVIQSEN